jgi:hypothetical protein
MQTNSVKRIGVNFGIFVLAMCALLVSLEIALAFLQINTKSNTLYIPNKGSKHVPGAYFRVTREGFSEGYFNSHGFRDRERSHFKPSNTFRILVLGDSQVEALEVALEDTFPALMEESLNVESRTTRFEVLSLGQSGFSTAEEYMRYVNFGVEFSPDLVLLAVTTANDIQDNSRLLSWESTRVYFNFDENGNLVMDRSLIDAYEKSLTLSKRLFQTLKRHSYLASLVSERLFLLKEMFHRPQFEQVYRKPGKSRGKEKLTEFSELNIYLTDLNPRWQEAYELTKRIILELKTAVEEKGAIFVLMTLTNAEQVHPEVAEQLNKQYDLIFDYEQPDRILEDFAKQEGITLLRLMPSFRNYHLRTGQYLHGFGSSMIGHWNQRGHRLAAEEILKVLKEKRLVPINGSIPIHAGT